MRRAARPRRWWSNPWPRIILSLGLACGLGSVGTFAYWTDQVPVTGVTFSSGSIDLRVNNQDSVSGYTTLNLTAMVPGNSSAGVLTIRNQGLSPLKYVATSSATNADGKNLRGGLTVKVTGDSAVSGSGASSTCSGSALSGTTSALNGDLITTGRLLQPSTSETLCVQVSLPTNAASALQGATSDISFTFTATSDLS
ncbi:MAG TPA: TasA family protein [Aeromicrobium sp.]|nr:TasA family protein [Aeromicrobium sp.]